MTAGSLSEVPTRLAQGFRRHGLRGALRRAASLREQPVWFELDLSAPRDPRALPAGMRLRPGTRADAGALPDELRRQQHSALVARLDDPATELWVVESGDGLVFACWLFGSSTPVATAPGGRLELPEGVVCLEDSMAAPTVRGQGVAPAVWTALAARLLERGERWMITKVDATNAPSTRAVTKAGFVPVLRMAVRRTGPFWRARATEPPSGDRAAALLASLER